MRNNNNINKTETDIALLKNSYNIIIDKGIVSLLEIIINCLFAHKKQSTEFNKNPTDTFILLIPNIKILINLKHFKNLGLNTGDSQPQKLLFFKVISVFCKGNPICDVVQI